jgi:hypothetical protein
VEDGLTIRLLPNASRIDVRASAPFNHSSTDVNVAPTNDGLTGTAERSFGSPRDSGECRARRAAAHVDAVDTFPKHVDKMQ